MKVQQGEDIVLDHMGFPVSDIERSKAFYDAVLAPLGITLMMTVTRQMTQNGGTALGYGKGENPFFWIGDEGRTAAQARALKVGEGMHVALRSTPAPRSTPFTRRRCRQAARIMGRQVFARNTALPTTRPSCSIRTAPTSRRSAMRLNSGACAQAGRGPSRMMAAPAKHTVAPMRSHRSGRAPSASHSQASAEAM